jgi:hypothetical protein
MEPEIRESWNKYKRKVLQINIKNKTKTKISNKFKNIIFDYIEVRQTKDEKGSNFEF